LGGANIAILGISGNLAHFAASAIKTLMFFRLRHTKLYRSAAKLALFAILLQTLLPLIHHPAQAAPMQAGVHICSVTHHTTNSDKSSAPKQQCPVCSALHLFGGGYMPPAGDEIIVAFSDTHTIVIHDDEFAVRPFVWPGIGSRAPPAFA
jgi:Protein of unknown function (DUF2946)